MKIKFKKVLAVFAMSAVTVFSAFAAGCDNSASDWIEDKIDQLKCEHVTTKIVERIEPTCTEKGKTEGLECVDCGKIVTKPDTIDAKGHVLIHYDEEKATCLVNGTSEGEYCTVCETWVKERKTIKATGHKIVAMQAKEPTCTETGLTLGQKCENCDDVYVVQKVIPAKGHTPDDDGYCLVCGELDLQGVASGVTSGRLKTTSVSTSEKIVGSVYRLTFEISNMYEPEVPTSLKYWAEMVFSNGGFTVMDVGDKDLNPTAQGVGLFLNALSLGFLSNEFGPCSDLGGTIDYYVEESEDGTKAYMYLYIENGDLLIATKYGYTIKVNENLAFSSGVNVLERVEL